MCAAVSTATATAVMPTTSLALATSSSDALSSGSEIKNAAQNIEMASTESSGSTNESTIGGANSNNIMPEIYKNPAICRYFLQGICRFGSLCHFSHDLSGGEVTAMNVDGSGLVTGDDVATTSSAASVGDKLHKTQIDKKKWINAPVFVPGGLRGRVASTTATNGDESASDITDVATASNEFCGKSWADVVFGGSSNASGSSSTMFRTSAPNTIDLVCPYEGPCPYSVYCPYKIHLELCKMCDQFCLHPNDTEQRRKHNRECLQNHEQDMELSFAIARSRDKTCGICMDIIMEKAGREKRFGILPNCTHVFCLECIRKWRQAKQFEHKITRACPECRIASDFVCPSSFWVDTKEEKEKLLTDYRKALGNKDCKYFKKGDGKCPFGNKCFYKHALANGQIVDVGCPRKRTRKLQRQNDEIIDLLDIYLWEFVDQRDFNFLDFLSSTSDITDDSDYSEED